MAEQSTCRSRRASILWAITLAGKRMPLDADPHPDGNVSLVPAGAIVLTKELVEQGKKAGTERYRSHFVTCPSADRHRKPASTQTPPK